MAMVMKKSKILLINPDPRPYHSTTNLDVGIPMGVLAVGSYLKKSGFQVDI